MFKWWINRKRRKMERDYPLNSPVYIRYYSERYTGTVAGWDGSEVLVRISDAKVVLYESTCVTIIEDKVERTNASV